MNEAHRNTLQQNRRQLANDIILTEDFFAALMSKGIFDDRLTRLIKAEKTETDKIYKMLELLPKRGPHAFESFVEVLNEDHPWLATQLMSYTQTHDNIQIETYRSIAESTETVTDTQRNLKSCDQDIKKLVMTFVHHQFGQSRRITEKDKRAMEKFLSAQLHLERVRYQSMLPSTPSSSDISMTSDGNTYDVLRDPEVQVRLLNIFLQIEQQLDGDNENHDSGKMLPDELTFEKVQCEVDKLIHKLNTQEKIILKCIDCFTTEDRRSPQILPELITSAQTRLSQHKKEIEDLRVKVTDLNADLNEYAEDIYKLEKGRDQSRRQMVALERENIKLRDENKALVEKCTKLEHTIQEQTEKDNDANHKSLTEETMKQSIVKRPIKIVQTKQSVNYVKRHAAGKSLSRKKGLSYNLLNKH